MLQPETASEVSEAAGKLSARTVSPGQDLGTLHVEEGETGKSVTGQEIQLDAGSGKTAAEPGSGVIKSGTTFTAALYGYAGLIDGQASVLPPFWTSADAMVSAYVNVGLEGTSATPTPEELTASAKEAGIVWGLDANVIASISEGLGKRKFKPLLPIARGQAPTESVDATPEFSFPYLTQLGLVLEDGSISPNGTHFPALSKAQRWSRERLARRERRATR